MKFPFCFYFFSTFLLPLRALIAANYVNDEQRALLIDQLSDRDCNKDSFSSFKEGYTANIRIFA